MLDNVKITGDLSIAVYDNDVLKDSRVIKNMIVTSGKKIIANLIAGSSAFPSHIAFGSDSSPAAVEQTGLLAEINSRIAFNAVTVTDNVVTFTATLNPGVGTGTYAEAGIFTAATLGLMLSRTTFNTIIKTSVDKLVITWNIRVN